MRLFLILFSANILFTACQEVATPLDQTDKPSTFFDLKGFFQKEKAQLETIKQFKKIVSINGQSETNDLTSLNLDIELSIFIASDINKPAWSDKYKADSSFTAQQQLASISYLALDESLKTKKININFNEGVVSSITIEKATNNAVAQSKQLLTYQVSKGYQVKSEQKLTLDDTKIITVDVTY